MDIHRTKFRSLTLNEIIEELENNDDDDNQIPDRIHILPPDTCNTELTDEDSGDENIVTLQNLPGGQLRATAEVFYEAASSTEDSSDDEITLSAFAKRRCIDNTSSDLQLQPSSPLPTTSQVIPKTLISKNKVYKWVKRDIETSHTEWLDKQGPQHKEKPMYFFDLMFGDDVINMLVTYTNLYASQKNKTGNVTFNEMKCFLGILLFSGYVVLPRRSMYWENSTDCGMPIVYNAMSRDRFTFIMSNLHCCDNTDLASNDKFAKMRPLFDMISRNFFEHAPYEENYSIDEGMVPYYGGHSCKQFIRGKPIRWGYKFWVGATRLGYIVWFDPYQGQSGEISAEYKKMGLGASVILRFADVLQKIDEQAPFHLYFDNFFTSVPLIDELQERGLKATGTIRENRLSKCPLRSNKDLQKTDRGFFDFRSSRQENILVCKWHDNSVVTVASNAVRVQPTHRVKRFSQQQKKYILVEQPAAIKAYNENMGGVDRSDQNIGLYRTSIRGKKWYFSLFTHCLDMAAHNAWQLYKKNSGDYDHLKFRRSVTASLLESFKKTENRKCSRTSQSLHETSRYDNIGHVIKYRQNQLRCSVCHKKASFLCKKCNVTLHPKDCFEIYHSLE